MGTGQLSRSIPHQDLRTYYSYVNGERRESGEWVYVVDSNALLDDVFATLRLKRRLEQGRPEDTPGELPDTVVGRVAKADRDTVELAVKAAASAAPEWGAVPLDTRVDRFAELLHRRISENAEQIAAVLVAEGHPLPLARWQVSGMLEIFGPRSAAFYRSQMLQEFRHGERRLQVRRRPDGVVCLNPPQNAPLSSAMLGATSIMAGNALVVRAPRSGPLGVMYVLQEIVAPVLDELGAPGGVLNAVCGDPAPMLSVWLDSPEVDDIIYFGSSENGVRFEQRCVAAGKKPILELAGNDVVTVWKDADVELAAEALTESFYGSGQLCMIPNQVVVHPDVADRLTEELVRRVREIRPGRPQDPEVLLTPVLRNEKFFTCLEQALDNGAELLTGGHAMQLDGARDPHGIFLEPTVLLVRGLAHARELDAVRHETFFPLLPVVVAEPADDETLLDRFVSFVESNDYGLRNSLWARDERVVTHFTDRVTGGGLLKVNDSHIGFLPCLPTHGGTGLTGGVFGEANYPILRTSHVQGVSFSEGSRPREAVFGAWRELFG
ncbi:aldehyde dehydrogenase family protein [Streptomyces sp. NRRL S-1521]|uniref:aldehyde dehydrogenase family protein n=1 Tax=Streptomyces sp. NRRL S-1521 TaxID=1609100 RepID=UPI00074A1EB0|nr:aldehyde dehydrogenase family protein [Streptomyces sp. NRRL S-1521]KUL55615.1 aldehyde dehydrogenase [Streptomyces sp. NRRL S-1521]